MTTPAGVMLVICMCGRTVTEVASDGCPCGPRITQPCDHCRDLVLRFGGLDRAIKPGRVLVMQTYDLAAGKVDEGATRVIFDYEPGNRGADRGGEPQDPSILKAALSERRARAQAKEASHGDDR